MGWWWILAQQQPALPITPGEVNNPVDWVNAIGLASLLVVFIADKLLNYLKSRGVDLQDISHKINDLHGWHNHDDPDQPGVKIWWNQKYLAEVIRESAKIQRSQTDLLREMHREQKTSTQIQEELVRLLTGVVKNQTELMRLMVDIREGQKAGK